MMKLNVSLLFMLVLASSLNSRAQGYMMLAGGGSEVAGGWSDAPYRWVVEHAGNKRIAIITYDQASTQWIPDYFKSFGAKSAKNFIIKSKEEANSQALYDSLITCNGIFIKGGDQYKYYEYYKGTKTQAAIQLVYNQGGVISGTSAGAAILSPIVFTAQVASVDPGAALMNAYSPQITLANDFIQSFSNKFICDTHFIERGRFGRLPSFMASWYKKTGEIAIGLGVDDHTAICIDAKGMAEIFGTGAVSIISNRRTVEPYDTAIDLLRAPEMNNAQFLHGCKLDLKTFESQGLSNFIQATVAEETERLNLLFCGTDYPSDQAYSYFLNETGTKEDAILIVTGENLNRANDIKLRLQEKGAADVFIIQTLSGNQDNEQLGKFIGQAKKLIVVSNPYSGFIQFMQGAGNGKLLLSKMKQEQTVSFFVGDNARFAGKTVVDKYMGSGFSSYHGTLEFLPGLALLKTTAIMPNTFIDEDTYENTVSGLPYAMFTDSIKYGLYLTGNTMAGYKSTSENSTYFKNLSGNFPLIFLENNGTHSGFASQGPYSDSRNISGFKSVDLKFLGISDTVSVGKHIPSAINLFKQFPVRIYPNPVNDILHIQANSVFSLLQIIGFTGQIVFEEQFSGSFDVNLSVLPEGMYLVRICDLNSNRCYTDKLNVIH